MYHVKRFVIIDTEHQECSSFQKIDHIVEDATKIQTGKCTTCVGKTVHFQKRDNVNDDTEAFTNKYLLRLL